MIQKTTGVNIIQPKITQRIWKKGESLTKQHDYLPGYLFIYTEEPLTAFYEIRRISGVFRILGTKENGYELTGGDRAFAELLLGMDGVIGILKTYQEGETVKLDQSLYKGFEGVIVKLDRRKARALVEFDFDSSTQRVWVGYEMIRSS